LKSLAVVQLERCSGLTAEGLEKIAALPSLSALDLTGTVLKDEQVAKLAGAKTLKVLLLGGTRVSDAGLKQLAGLSALAILDLTGTDIGRGGFGVIAQFPELQVLGVSNCIDLKANGLNQLTKLKHLSALYLGGETLWVDYLKVLQANNLLDRVSIHQGIVSIDVIPRSEKEGVSLDLHEMVNFGNKDMKLLASLKNLRALNVSHSFVGDEEMKVVAGLTTLTELDISFTSVSDDGLKALAGLKQLRELNLKGTAITPDGMGVLKKLKSLTRLSLEADKWPEAKLKELRAALPGCRVDPLDP
jgi:hypothetical protein